MNGITFLKYGLLGLGGWFIGNLGEPQNLIYTVIGMVLFGIGVQLREK